MMRSIAWLGVLGILAMGSSSCKGVTGENNNGDPPPVCTGGTDLDQDGYGPGCPAGPDCNDNDATVHPKATELCDSIDNDCDGEIDEGVKNACGSCSATCEETGNGNAPFPLDPSKDPRVKDASGVKLDPNGDLVLDAAMVNFNYMWISNTYDLGGSGACASATPADKAACRGTISKVDTVKMQEVARYVTVLCPGATCSDVNGLPLVRDHAYTPSRTAVDFNFDVWVANRSVHGGQPVATKIANDINDCIDRNKNGQIETSKDQDGDGKINPDCDGDGHLDNAKTVCVGSLAGKSPEFLSDDDECIIFSVAYGEKNDVGRSICLDTGKNTVGASAAWVGTFYRPENGRGSNRFYMINGTSGKIEANVELPAGHHTYGCMADAHHVIWSTDIGTSSGGKSWNGSLAFFSSRPPYSVGPLMRGPTAENPWKDASGQYHQYGISINADQHIWLGGWTSSWVLRYKPVRTDFASLGKGTWTRIDGIPGWHTRGIAADNRGKVWTAVQSGGYIWRLDQNIPDGVHDLSSKLQENKDYWRTKANTVIGVGVDFNGHLWGVGHANHMASRLDVDAQGNVVNPPTGLTKNVMIGKAPYTYSDFTGYGLMNFVRPQGRWVYQLKGCPEGVKATWTGVSWKATTPTGTAVTLRVRTGDSDTTFGPWSTEYTVPPAVFGPGSKVPIKPNPAIYLQVEFTLTNQNKDTTPILHDYAVGFTCMGTPS